MTKIYTRGGDNGTASALNGSRYDKDSILMEAVGALDETSAIIGTAAVYAASGKVKDVLHSLQHLLFDLGAELSGGDKFPPRINPEDVEKLENLIDEFEAQLPPLKNFILAGGSEASSFLHFARTATRRTERRIVSLSREQKVEAEALAFINRLSDLLFVLSRVENNNGEADVLWQKR